MGIKQSATFKDFKSLAKSYKIEINNNQLMLFGRYHEILIEWNKKINLISRKGEDSIIEKHFLDSILFLPEIENLCTGVLQYTRTIFDIGSGGGFPAIPLSIMKPEWEFILCESITKKANFLTHLVKELGLEKQIEIINDRVESIASKGRFKTCLNKTEYDLVTARAIAKLDKLIKYALPILKKGGYLIAYKAKGIDDEIKNAEELIKKNNLELKIFSKELNGVERKLVIIQFM